MEDKVIGKLTLNDLSVLSTMLQFYERYLWNTLAPSVKRTRQMTEIQLVIVKVYQLPQSPAMLLTVREMAYINAAITLFINQVKQRIEPPKNRDEVLASCE